MSFEEFMVAETKNRTQKLVVALREKIEQAELLKSKAYDCAEFPAWRASINQLLEMSGLTAFHSQFRSLQFRVQVIRDLFKESPEEAKRREVKLSQERYLKSLRSARSIIQDAISALERFGIPESAPVMTSAEHPTRQRQATGSRMVEVPKVDRQAEAQRFLDGAREKKSCGDILKQNNRWTCAAQMYQQAMELSMKAVMILCSGQYRTEHEFKAPHIASTLREWAKKSTSAEGPNLDACFSAANRWASIHSDSVYGYSYGRPAHAVTGQKEAETAAEDALKCVLAAQEVARITGK